MCLGWHFQGVYGSVCARLNLSSIIPGEFAEASNYSGVLMSCRALHAVKLPICVEIAAVLLKSYLKVNSLMLFMK